MSYQNGLQNEIAAARNPFAQKYGPAQGEPRSLVDDAYPNNWYWYSDNAAGLGKIHALVLADALNQLRLINPNGARAWALSVDKLLTPAAPTVSPQGTVGVTSYSYEVVAVSGTGASLGWTAASAAGSTTTGNATLSGTNFNLITFTAVAGAAAYYIYRTAGGSTQGLIGTVASIVNQATGLQMATFTFSDTGLAADGSTAPTTNSTGFLQAAIYGDIQTFQVPTPVAPTLATVGTAGATTYDYKIVARSANGTTPASAATAITTGNATLSASNYIVITWEPVPGAVSYDIYRTVGGSTQGKIGNVLTTALTGLIFNDTGLAATGTAPTTNTTGGVVAAGGISGKGTTISSQASNFIATETGANNAITAALVDGQGNNVPLAAGLQVYVLLAHSLQAGANTFAINGGAAKNITSHRNTGSNIGTAYVSGGVVQLMYDGTQWQDMSQ